MNKGIQNILIASLFFSIINALVKYFDRIPAIEIVFFRSVCSLIICYYSIHKLKIKIFNKYTPTLILRGLAGCISLCLYFFTIQNMPLATAVTLLYLAPIFTIIFAIPIIGDKPQKKQIPFFLICFIGAALVKNIDFRVNNTHFLFGVASAIFAALAYNFIRLLKDKVNHNLIIFYFPLVTIPITLPWVINSWVTPTFTEFLGLILIGIFTQIAQVFMTKAYMLEKAAKISHYNYMTSFWAAVTGIILFNEALNIYTIAGMSLIFIGIFYSSKFSEKVT